MSTFLIPFTLCDDLDATVGHFWWCGSMEKYHFLAFLTWNDIFLPKSSGGLGIRLFVDINFAFFSKLGYLVLSQPSSMWVAVFHAKYCLNECIWIVKLPLITLWYEKEFLVRKN